MGTGTLVVSNALLLLVLIPDLPQIGLAISLSAKMRGAETLVVPRKEGKIGSATGFISSL